MPVGARVHPRRAPIAWLRACSPAPDLRRTSTPPPSATQDELEQILLCKYKARSHWGKSSTRMLVRVPPVLEGAHLPVQSLLLLTRFCFACLARAPPQVPGKCHTRDNIGPTVRPPLFLLSPLTPLTRGCSRLVSCRAPPTPAGLRPPASPAPPSPSS